MERRGPIHQSVGPRVRQQRTRMRAERGHSAKRYLAGVVVLVVLGVSATAVLLRVTLGERSNISRERGSEAVTPKREGLRVGVEAKAERACCDSGDTSQVLHPGEISHLLQLVASLPPVVIDCLPVRLRYEIEFLVLKGLIHEVLSFEERWEMNGGGRSQPAPGLAEPTGKTAE